MSQMTPAQIEIALKAPAKPLKSEQPQDFVYDPANDEILEAENFHQLMKELEEEGQLPVYILRLRCALYHILDYSPRDEDLPLLQGLVVSTRSEKLRQQAVGSLRDYVVDCSGGRNASLKPGVREFLQQWEAI